ncbi:MAG: glycoside hydrolase family 2 TIM barrel-domain containing protein, partial [bacterium]|nr:glycoside hydrolase family 2 TIM barrel-domain containing protein [bacterium]
MLTSLSALCLLAATALAQPIPVALTGAPGNYTLQRDGKPYFITSAGGVDAIASLAAAGGNSVRTWGADDIGPLLDEAHRLGMTVTVGIWLEHERHGFDYGNAEMVAAQLEKAKAAILKYKDHPAVLMWGIGNEMEGDGNDEAIWVAVNAIAKMAKELDPNHPTMTVVAEMGDKGQKVKNIHRLCPDIDIIGLNSYGGGPSIAERYKALGGTKPYIITEFGPNGTWEIGRNSFKAPIELTSTQKAASYRATYEKSVLGAKGTSLGSYAFLWGNKMEATATWFGMLLPDGTRLAAAETMSELWTGKPPANRVPVISTIAYGGADQEKQGRGKKGDQLKINLAVTDPESDTLTTEWVLMRETTQYETGGDPIATPEQLAASVHDASLT